MAVKTAYLASEDSAMERRSRRLHRFLVASPAALLLVVGLVAHMPHPPYPHPAGDAAYDRKVLAYAPRVAAVQSLDGLQKATTDSLEREARAWIAGYASGELAPVTAAVFEDHFMYGIRSEIVRAGLNLAGAINQRAEATASAGQAEAGARTSVLAGEVAFGLRGFDLQAHLQALLAVRRSEGTLIRMWPTVPASVKTELRPRLRAMLIDRAEVDRLDALERSQFDAYLRRQKIDEGDAAPSLRLARGSKGPETAAALSGAEKSNAQIRQLLGR